MGFEDRKKEKYQGVEKFIKKMKVSQIVTYLVYDGLRYRFKVLISRVRQATKDVVKSEV